MSGLLFGIRATDLLTFVLMAGLLMAVALLACWLSAGDKGRTDDCTEV